MYLTVQYLRDINNNETKCWSFAPLTLDVQEATLQGRDGQGDARTYFGATSFRVVDDAGRVLAIELMPAKPLPGPPASSMYRRQLAS